MVQKPFFQCSTQILLLNVRQLTPPIMWIQCDSGSSCILIPRKLRTNTRTNQNQKKKKCDRQKKSGGRTHFFLCLCPFDAWTQFNSINGSATESICNGKKYGLHMFALFSLSQLQQMTFINKWLGMGKNGKPFCFFFIIIVAVMMAVNFQPTNSFQLDAIFCLLVYYWVGIINVTLLMKWHIGYKCMAHISSKFWIFVNAACTAIGRVLIILNLL